MKMRHSVKWMLMGALVVPHLTACSFGGEGEEEEVEASEEGNAADVGEEGNNVAVEGAESNVANGAEGNVAFEDANANAMPGMEGAEAASNDIPPELLNSQNETAGAEGMPMTDVTAEAAPMDAVPAEGNAIPTEGNAAAAAPAPVAASGDARVYFVNVDSASIHSGADASSSSVGTVSKGDPVLVTIEGNWANVANRGYIEVANLSQTPVGRTISSKSWQ